MTVAATSHQNWPVDTATALSRLAPSATSSPAWNYALRPQRDCVRATSPVDSALPTT